MKNLLLLFLVITSPLKSFANDSTERVASETLSFSCEEDTALSAKWGNRYLSTRRVMNTDAASCHWFSLQLNNAFRRIPTESLGSLTFDCVGDPDGTTRVYYSLDSQRHRLLTVMGQSNQDRLEKCAVLADNLRDLLQKD